MDQLPHTYQVSVCGSAQDAVIASADQLPDIQTAPPPQFGGTGRDWSPETLLLAAVADCFVLGFRAIAKASRFDWASLTCTATGTLDKDEHGVRFTGKSTSPSQATFPPAAQPFHPHR